MRVKKKESLCQSIFILDCLNKSQLAFLAIIGYIKAANVKSRLVLFSEENVRTPIFHMYWTFFHRMNLSPIVLLPKTFLRNRENRVSIVIDSPSRTTNTAIMATHDENRVLVEGCNNRTGAIHP